METLILIVFIAGYVAIAFEHSLMVGKAGTALLTGILCWTIYVTQGPDAHGALHLLNEQVLEIAQILFFLIGAMTIVELIDVHKGFDVLTNAIRTRSKVGLLWLVAFITFFLSAALDNLTTSIVMVSILGKLIDDRRDRLFFAGMVIVAANAGGAWSPIGDVTTTMLWMKDKISSIEVIQRLLLPSLVSLIVPVTVMSFLVRGRVTPPQNLDRGPDAVESQKRLITALGLGEKVGEPVAVPVMVDVPKFQKGLVLGLGVLGLLFVPVFKVLTHLPPFMGMMLSLSVLWIVTELLHKRSDSPERERLSPAKALERIDIPSMLFFMGILLAVGALQASGLLAEFAKWLDDTLPNRNMVAIAIGIVSAVVDNVPLVAGAIQMYDPANYPELVMDHNFWHFLAFTAGTGGSILIIGSAAGVAVMGMERMEFFWYLKRISLLALLGYFAGAGVFLLMG